MPAGAPTVVREPASAAAAIAGEAVPSGWIRRPGEWDPVPPSEEPALIDAVGSRNRRLEMRAVREAWALASPWMALSVLYAIRHPEVGLLVGLIAAAPAVMQTWDCLRSRRRWRMAPQQAARRDGIRVRVATWLGGRPGLGRWSVAVAVLVGIVTAATAFAGDAGRRVAMVDPAAIRAGAWWQLATGPLLHAGLFHVVFNLMAWFGLGDLLARLLGRGVPVAVLGLGMVAGACATTLWDGGRPSVGMSGGVSALFGLVAAAWWRWRAASPPGLARMAAINALWMVAISVAGAGIVDHAAHAGGFAAGLLAGFLAVPPAPGPILADRGWRIATWIVFAGLVAAGAAAIALVWG